MRKRSALRALILVLALGGFGTAAAAKSKRDEAQVQKLEDAGLLVREGEWIRARVELEAVNPEARGLDQVRLYTLIGLVELHDKRGAEAEAAFAHALAITADGRADGRGLLHLHLARACLMNNHPEDAVAALDAAGEVGAALPGTWLLRAQAEEARGSPDEAWSALREGAQRFPEQGEAGRRQVFLLVRLGLFREARELGERLLARPDADADDAVAIAEALRQGGETREAMTLLEAACLREGEDRDLLVQAARAALDDGLPRAAGRFLERAAAIDPALSLEAAEAYRRAGEHDAALRANGRVLDPVAKARQRLGLLLDAEEWERAMALDERLLRLGLGTDSGVAYGLAYAAFRLGDLSTAERWLRDITEPEAFRRATDLREAMAACAEAGCP